MNATLLFGLLAPTTAGLLLLTPDFVRLVIAPDFRETTLAILPIAALAGAIRNFRMHFSDQALLLFEQTGGALATAAVEAVATLALCWFGAISWGLAGAALGCLGGAVIGAMFSFTLCRLRNGLPFPSAHLARILAATLAMSGVLRVLPWADWSATLALRMIAEVLLGALIYGAMLSAFYPDEIRKGVRWARKLRAPAAGPNL